MGHHTRLTGTRLASLASRNGTEGTIHLVTETINPFHAAPLAVYPKKKGTPYPNFYAKPITGSMVGRLQRGMDPDPPAAL
jgi:hypothetical protein